MNEMNAAVTPAAVASYVAIGAVASLTGLLVARVLFRMETRGAERRAPRPARLTSADEVEQMDTTTGSIPGVVSLTERRNRPRLAR